MIVKRPLLRYLATLLFIVLALLFIVRFSIEGIDRHTKLTSIFIFSSFERLTPAQTADYIAVALSEIQETHGLDQENISLMEIYQPEFRALLEQNAWIDYIELYKEWPSTLSIRIVEQQPVAYFANTNHWINRRGEFFYNMDLALKDNESNLDAHEIDNIIETQLIESSEIRQQGYNMSEQAQPTQQDFTSHGKHFRMFGQRVSDSFNFFEEKDIYYRQMKFEEILFNVDDLVFDDDKLGTDFVTLVDDMKLPVLVSHYEDQKNVFEIFQKVSKLFHLAIKSNVILSPLIHDIWIQKFILKPHQGYELTLSNSMVVHLEADQLFEKMNTLIVFLNMIDDWTSVASLDLRYHNGFSVAWSSSIHKKQLENNLNLRTLKEVEAHFQAGF